MGKIGFRLLGVLFFRGPETVAECEEGESIIELSIGAEILLSYSYSIEILQKPILISKAPITPLLVALI